MVEKTPGIKGALETESPRKHWNESIELCWDGHCNPTERTGISFHSGSACSEGPDASQVWKRFYRRGSKVRATVRSNGA